MSNERWFQEGLGSIALLALGGCLSACGSQGSATEDGEPAPVESGDSGREAASNADLGLAKTAAAIGGWTPDPLEAARQTFALREANRAEILRRYDAMRARLRLVQSTTEPDGTVLDWVKVDGAPAPPAEPAEMVSERSRMFSVPGLEHTPSLFRAGPPGTVGIPRVDYAARLDQLAARIGYVPAADVVFQNELLEGGLPVVDKDAPGTANGTTGRATKGVAQSTANKGVYGRLNVWTPVLECDGDPACGGGVTASDMSLLQGHAVANDSAGKVLDSIEMGWRVYPTTAGTTSPVGFIFYTTTGYKTQALNKGGYIHSPAQQMCKEFTGKSTDPACPYVPIAGKPIFSNQVTQPQSVTNGNQYFMGIWIQESGGVWWVGTTADSWLGSFRSSIFNVLSTGQAQWTGFQGEVTDHDDNLFPSSQMGSGMVPGTSYDANWKKAAFISDMHYNSTAGAWTDYPTNATRTGTVDDRCYSFWRSPNRGDENWETYGFVGGSGRLSAGCP